MLSAATRRELEQALAERLGSVAVASVEPIGGGCISPVVRVQLEDGRAVFLKLAGAEPPGGASRLEERPGGAPGPSEPEGDALLAAEAFALGVMGRAGGVRVPEVLALGRTWLALEWLEAGAPAQSAWEVLGAGLASLHRAGGSHAPGWGWPRDNFIGSLPQANAPCDEWPRFWRDRRLEPQLERASAAGLLRPAETAAFQPLLERLPALLAAGEADGPSLLHGDLWSGNVVMLAAGGAAVVDPASYYGHREVDLAMAALFGGFGPGFFRAYQDAWPLPAVGLEQRRATYQLYYLLVHVNLFGRGYVRGTMAALERALA